ncbi:MAG: hypothetical protein ACM3PP_10260 [Candidatus Saccharibacteria bacterium]
MIILLLTAENQTQPANQWVTVDRNPVSLALTQQEADNGHFPELLDAEKVARDYIQNTLELGPIKDIKFRTTYTLKAELLATLNDGRQIEITLVRPVRKDEGGIWAVDRYRIRNR